MSIEIFYHMYCVEDCVERFLSTYNKIKNAGLLEQCTNIYVILVGNNCDVYKEEIKNLSKVVPFIRNNASGEMETLKFIHDFCQKFPNTKILYLHSKGATKKDNENIKAWVNYMEYFLIEKYLDCLNYLQEFDTVGVDYGDSPMKHYSGNFWWANGSYINSHKSFEEGFNSCTNNNITDSRWYCEFWILHEDNVRVKTVHSSNTNLYDKIYERHRYDLTCQKTLDIIISRYNENIDWLNTINVDLKRIFLYNKHENEVLDNSIKLENIGREAHTYLTHIINNYNDLADFNVFCQGNPNHYSSFVSYINERTYEQNNKQFEWLADSLFESDLFGGPHHHIPIDIKALSHSINLEINSSQITFGPGAQFVATRELIKKRPVEFYQNILNQFSENCYANSYKEDDIAHNRNFNQYYHIACILERIWELILHNN